MKLKPVIQIILLASMLLVLALFSLWQVQQISLAQGGVDISKTLNRSSNVVRVGEVLSFSIVLTNNNSTLSLTQVTLVDEYEQDILAYAWATPAPDGLMQAGGQITWAIAAVNPIDPGQSITVTLAFTAEHPQTAVVNYARAEDLEYSDGSSEVTATTSRTNEAIGGAAPIVKSLHPPGSTPQTGLPLTFTHIITNDGAALMTRLPLTDTYDPAFLEFHFARPITPDIISQANGLLVWTDLTDHFGDIQPFDSVVITTVFTATTRVVNTVNQASTEGAIDVYNNILDAGATQVPITIISDATATLTPAPADDDDDEEEADTPTPFPTSTPTVAALAAITATPQSTAAVQGPLYLPETGRQMALKFAVPLAGLLLLALGWLAAGKKK